MLYNYLSLALRNLRKNKTFSFLNIAGLTLGMACCLLIVLYVRRERNMDTFHAAGEEIYKVMLHVQMADGQLRMAALPPGFAPRLAREITGVERFVRVYDTGKTSVSKTPQQVFYEEGLYADSTFFQIFSFPIQKGETASKALTRGENIVISQRLADKYFPNEDPVGQILTLDASRKHTVAAVMRNVPDNSHLQFDFVLPWSALAKLEPEAEDNNFGWAGPTAFVQLAKGVKAQNIENQIPDLLKRHLPDARATRFSLHLQALREVYFGSADYQGVLAKSLGNARYLKIFSWLAALILGIACINFMNLSTARAAERAREVGMRKSLGATKKQLVGQFLAEGMLTALFAFMLALGLAALLAPLSGPFFGVPLRLDFGADPMLLGVFAGIASATGLVAGFYPAFVLSAFQPVEVLKNAMRQKLAGLWLRKGLVVGQFAATVALILGSLVVFRQMRHLQDKNPGFNREHVLVLPLQGEVSRQKSALLKEAFQKTAGVLSVCHASDAFDGSGGSSTTKPEGDTEDSGRQVIFYSVDDEWLQTTGVRLAAGRFFSPAFPADTAKHLGAVLVNETAAREFGWGTPEQALGKRINANRDTSIVVGVVADFNFVSLREALEPIIIYKVPKEWGHLMLRLEGGNPKNMIATAQSIWQQTLPEYPFEYYFLDEHLSALYETEERVARLSGVATLLAILVACLGLFGLALFTMQRRTKEIGIRKVLGASVVGITGLLAKEFLKLVLIAIIIASPIAYYLMQQWLSDFAYRIDMQWWMFAGAGLLAVTVAFLTVGFQSARAALANPVKSLRSE